MPGMIPVITPLTAKLYETYVTKKLNVFDNPKYDQYIPLLKKPNTVDYINNVNNTMGGRRNSSRKFQKKKTSRNRRKSVRRNRRH